MKHAILSNLHTHTAYCDGKDTPEQIVLSAIAQGLESVGFSGHSYVHFDLDCCMTPQETLSYKSDLVRLQAQYKDRLDILIGIEQDFYSDLFAKDYDFIIGSTHYLPDADNTFFSVDHSKALLLDAANRCFDGDLYKLIDVYYQHQARLFEQTGCTVVGHFDLVTKFNEGNQLFDACDPRYRGSAYGALDALLERDLFFEINTGAISRGYRTAPYPSKPILKRIVEKGGRLVLSADAHAKENLLFGFEAAVAYAKNAGARSVWCLNSNGWVEQGI